MQRRPRPRRRGQLKPRQRRLGGLYVELNGDHETIAACLAEGQRNDREIFGWRRYYWWRLRVRRHLVSVVSTQPPPKEWERRSLPWAFEHGVEHRRLKSWNIQTRRKKREKLCAQQVAGLFRSEVSSMP